MNKFLNLQVRQYEAPIKSKMAARYEVPTHDELMAWINGDDLVNTIIIKDSDNNDGIQGNIEGGRDGREWPDGQGE